MGDAATPVLPDFTSQTAAAYKANLDAGFAVADRIAWAFAAHEETVPALTVRLEAGAVFDGATLTEIAAQSTGAITAPTIDPRIDRVVIDRATGAVSVVTGTEAPSPVAPAITAGDVPVWQVALVVSQTEIVNADITDERDLGLLGLGFLAADDIDGLTEETTIDGAADFVPIFDTSAGLPRKAKPDNLFASSGLVSVQVFTGNGTWTKPAGVTKVIAEVQAGGGGGGGVVVNQRSGGGGGGGYARELIDVTGTSSETITVGGGGAGGAAGSNPGTDGNTSSFGAFCSATGGKGAPGSSTIEISGGDGGVGSGGDINIKGSGGDGGPGSAAAPGGPGGGSHLGGGAKGSARNAGGFAGGNYGGGGGGTASSSGSRAGGNGAGGVVIVWEYK